MDYEFNTSKLIPSESIPALDLAARAALPNRISGLSLRRIGEATTIRFHFLTEPTPEEKTTAETTVVNFDTATRTPAEAEHASILVRVKNVAQTAVGTTIEDLTNAQIKALLAALLFESGAIAGDGTIKPLNQWVNT